MPFRTIHINSRYLSWIRGPPANKISWYFPPTVFFASLPASRVLASFSSSSSLISAVKHHASNSPFLLFAWAPHFSLLCTICSENVDPPLLEKDPPRLAVALMPHAAVLQCSGKGHWGHEEPRFWARTPSFPALHRYRAKLQSWPLWHCAYREATLIMQHHTTLGSTSIYLPLGLDSFTKKRRFSLLVNQCNLFRGSHLCLLGYERTGSVWHPQRSRLISLSLFDKQPVLRPISPGILTHRLAIFNPELLGRASFVTSHGKGGNPSHVRGLKLTRNADGWYGSGNTGATQPFLSQATWIMMIAKILIPCQWPCRGSTSKYSHQELAAQNTHKET